jgi:hypothetical protein
MAARLKKVAPKPTSARTRPLAHSGNGFQPAKEYIATLKGREKAYAEAVVEYTTHLRVTTKPVSLFPPDRTREINDALFNLFTTEEP